MITILLTGAGLGIGSGVSWLIDRKPTLFTRSVSEIKDQSGTGYPASIYFFAVLTGGIFFLLSGWESATDRIVVFAFFLSLLSTVATFDVRYQLIPNRLVLAGIAGWCMLAAFGMLPVLDSLLAGLAAGSTVFLVRLLGLWLYGKPGTGMGDVKLLFVMGLFLEWEVFWALYLAVLSGGLWAIGAMASNRLDRKAYLPFAPFLLTGTLLSVFILPFERFLNLWL